MRLTAASCVITVATTLLLSGCSGSDNESASSRSEPTNGVSISTLAGACALLVGPIEMFVDDALTAGAAVTASQGPPADKTAASKIQNSLFKIVSTGPAVLQDPTGTLVDYLDDPAAYTADGKVEAAITEAAATIRTACEA